MDESVMDEYVAVADVGEIPAGEGRSYPVKGRMIALFFQNGEYFAIDDACPHMGASLGAGHLEGTKVMCPWHAWQFCVKEGTWLDNPSSPLKCRTYPVRVRDGVVQVLVD